MTPEIIIGIIAVIGVFIFMKPGERTLTDRETKEFSRLYAMNKSFGGWENPKLSLLTDSPDRGAMTRNEALDIGISDVHIPQPLPQLSKHERKCDNCGAPKQAGNCFYCGQVVR